MKKPFTQTTVEGNEQLCRQVVGPIVKPWTSLIEGDEQLDQPNSQTNMELYHACVA